jgi:hypothetical protein
MSDYDSKDVGQFPAPHPEEVGLALSRDWTDKEELKAKRK